MQKKDVQHFSNLRNEIPYASEFNKRDEEDKKLAEASVIHEWVDSVYFLDGREVSKVVEGEDPPDFFVIQDGHLKSVELTEFVDGRLKGEVARRFNDGETITKSSPVIFNKSQWTESRFRSKLRELIDQKARR